MIVNADIKPLFAAFSPFLFWPFCLDFAALPSKDKYDDWHFKFERIVFFYLHSKYFSFSWEEAEFEFVWGGAIGFLDDVGVERRDGDLQSFVFFLVLHGIIRDWLNYPKGIQR